MSSLAPNWQSKWGNRMKVYCPRCRENYGNCLTKKAFLECVKWCELCDGTTRVPIPMAELFPGTR